MSYHLPRQPVGVVTGGEDVAEGGPRWMSVEALTPYLVKLKKIKMASLSTRGFIDTVNTVKSNLFALELFQDMTLSVSCGQSADYYGYSVNDGLKGVGAVACLASTGDRVRDVFARLSEDENVRESAAILPKGVTGKEWNDAVETLFFPRKCCAGMGQGLLSIETFCELGSHLLGKKQWGMFDDLIASLPLFQALWDAPILSALTSSENFGKVHRAYNALLAKYPAAYRILDPAIVIVGGNDAGMAADVAAIPTGAVAGGLNPVTLAVGPALHGNMTRVYNVGDIGEARTMIAFMKGRSNAYNMLAVSTAAGNFIAG